MSNKNIFNFVFRTIFYKQKRADFAVPLFSCPTSSNTQPTSGIPLNMWYLVQLLSLVTTETMQITHKSSLNLFV